MISYKENEHQEIYGILMGPCHNFKIVEATSTLQCFWPTPLKLSRDCNKFVINVDILLRLGLLF